MDDKDFRPVNRKYSSVNEYTKNYWKEFTNLFLKEHAGRMHNFRVSNQVMVSESGDVIIRVIVTTILDITQEMMEEIESQFPRGTRVQIRTEKFNRQSSIGTEQEQFVSIVIPNYGATSTFGDRRIYIDFFKGIVNLSILIGIAYVFSTSPIIVY